MLRRVVKCLTTRGLRASVRAFLRELQITAKHLRGVIRARKFSNRVGLKLNIACGPKLKEGWVNIDLSPNADLSIDLRESLPFEDGSCQIIYSEHFLEHLDYPEPTGLFLSECFRILEPRGVLNIGVPDTEWPILEYAGTRADGYFQFVKKQWHPKWCETEMEHLNYHFRMGNDHRFAYDFKTIELVLTRAGFVNIQTRDFDDALDSKDREIGTLYVKAMKPTKIP